MDLVKDQNDQRIGGISFFDLSALMGALMTSLALLEFGSKSSFLLVAGIGFLAFLLFETTNATENWKIALGYSISSLVVGFMIVYSKADAATAGVFTLLILLALASAFLVKMLIEIFETSFSLILQLDQKIDGLSRKKAGEMLASFSISALLGCIALVFKLLDDPALVEIYCILIVFVFFLWGIVNFFRCFAEEKTISFLSLVFIPMIYVVIVFLMNIKGANVPDLIALSLYAPLMGFLIIPSALVLIVMAAILICFAAWYAITPFRVGWCFFRNIWAWNRSL